MKTQNLSILVGTKVCNARCQFCISKMTPSNGIENRVLEIDRDKFRKVVEFAKKTHAETALITGKGEPTLYPEQMTQYLEILSEYDFKEIELQTNGLVLSEKKEKYDSYIKKWRKQGLSTIALSIVHYDSESNRKIYAPDKKSYPDLGNLIKYLHDNGYKVRLSTMLLRGMIDNAGELEKLVEFARSNEVEQLTVRPITVPEKSENQKVYNWTLKNTLKTNNLYEMINYAETNGEVKSILPYGGIIYDINGQNLCITNCLTKDSNPAEEVRQLIYFPDGKLRNNWEEKGEILI